MHRCPGTMLHTWIRERANRIVASINVQYLLLAVNRCVFVLDQLVDTVDEDIGVSCDVSRRNISPPYIPLFDHFPVEEEIWRERERKALLMSIRRFDVFSTFDIVQACVSHCRRDIFVSCCRNAWFRFSDLKRNKKGFCSRQSFRAENRSVRLFTFDFFGEFHSLCIVQWTSLFLDISNVENFTHEVDHGLWFVESCGTDWRQRERRAYSMPVDRVLPSMFNDMRQYEGRTDWWKPNQTSRPPPNGLYCTSGGEKNERPTGVYLNTEDQYWFSIEWSLRSIEKLSQPTTCPLEKKESPRNIHPKKGGKGRSGEERLTSC